MASARNIFIEKQVTEIVDAQGQSSAGPAFVVRDRDSALSGPVNGTGLGLKYVWSRKRDGTGTQIILVLKVGRDRDSNNFGLKKVTRLTGAIFAYGCEKWKK